MIFTLQFIAFSLLIVLLITACYLLGDLYRDFRRFLKLCWKNSKSKNSYEQSHTHQ
ncbi:hypothetical protein GVN20_05545 [Runella sp. CRIBMP]|uniref:hypothetical protein n=1 Tax=Runella sp. CRIBMP TaxID=2683261 RepID=UPI001412B706|nr:hypothetical protein [Runella sp. CRIBMP]NBB18814.1 hypothetical protein [Runella sp. CRIBMP]